LELGVGPYTELLRGNGTIGRQGAMSIWWQKKTLIQTIGVNPLIFEGSFSKASKRLCDKNGRASDASKQLPDYSLQDVVELKHKFKQLGFQKQ
jgi:hypothetical protein